jgi:hypothetical protein
MFLFFFSLIMKLHIFNFSDQHPFLVERVGAPEVPERRRRYRIH